jgi:hypothetical protein
MNDRIHLDHSLQDNVEKLVNTIGDYLGELSTESVHYSPTEFAAMEAAGAEIEVEPLQERVTLAG